MPGLLDLGPLTRDVKVAGKTLTVNPLRVEHVFTLIAQYDSFSRAMAAAKVTKEKELAAAMAHIGPDAMAFCVVACTNSAEVSQREIKLLGSKFQEGYVDKLQNLKAEKWQKAMAVASNLGAGDVFIILEAMYDLTFPDGIGPFVERFKALKAKADAMNQEENSPEESSSSLQVDDPLGKYGPPPQDKFTPGSQSSSESGSVH